MAGWKIPELNGGFNRKITYKYGPFSIAMFDFQRVPRASSGHENGMLEYTPQSLGFLPINAVFGGLG